MLTPIISNTPITVAVCTAATTPGTIQVAFLCEKWFTRAGPCDWKKTIRGSPWSDGEVRSCMEYRNPSEEVYG